MTKPPLYFTVRQWLRANRPQGVAGYPRVDALLGQNDITDQPAAEDGLKRLLDAAAMILIATHGWQYQQVTKKQDRTRHLIGGSAGAACGYLSRTPGNRGLGIGMGILSAALLFTAGSASQRGTGPGGQQR
jgi:hypothetical protein